MYHKQFFLILHILYEDSLYFLLQDCITRYILQNTNRDLEKNDTTSDDRIKMLRKERIINSSRLVNEYVVSPRHVWRYATARSRQSFDNRSANKLARNRFTRHRNQGAQQYFQAQFTFRSADTYDPIDLHNLIKCEHKFDV